VPRKSTKRHNAEPVASGDAEEVTLQIEGHAVTCTRLSKVLYPPSKFTKAQVIEFYIRVAPYILPHLKDHQVTLKRYTDRVTGEAYWEEDVPSFTPEWVETFPVPRHAGRPAINYILIQNAATLACAAERSRTGAPCVPCIVHTGPVRAGKVG
jgi:bifunctional non-homologous end joining protein LigD